MLVTFLTGLIVGCIVTYTLINLSARSKNKIILEDNIEQFSQILKNLNMDKTKFKSRVNNTIYIETNLNDYGKVGLVYFMDKRDIAIFKDEKCIYTSGLIDSNLINEIGKTIEMKYSKDINDVIEILGFVFSREDFEKSFEIDIKEMKNISKKEESDIEKIISNNNIKFDIDEILDKISKVGIENLTDDEKQFLKKYNK